LYIHCHTFFSEIEGNGPEKQTHNPLLLKIAPDTEKGKDGNSMVNISTETEYPTEDPSQFIQNEQLITICLAALGVTSTGIGL